MYIAVMSIIFGQGLIFANLMIIKYGIIVIILFETFVRVYEEPKLKKSFGGEYDTYCKNVHRWIPRISPWRNEK
jgi:protein-S-isoprenylcysteine O-methyltransferase Ste14